MKLLILFAVVSVPVCLSADGLPSQPYIYLEGRAEIQKSPDLVTLSFDVVGHNAERSKANEEAQSKANKVFALLQAAKIADSDVVAEDLSSAPEYEDEQYPQSRNKLIGYTVTRPITVKVRDTAGFPKLVDELIGIGGLEFSHIEGGLSKQKEVEEELSQKALLNARQEATKTLETMGMKIDSVFAVSSVSFSEIQRNILGTAESSRVIITGSNAPPAKPHVEPSQYRLAPLTISRSVNVLYLISPVK